MDDPIFDPWSSNSSNSDKINNASDFNNDDVFSDSFNAMKKHKCESTNVPYNIEDNTINLIGKCVSTKQHVIATGDEYSRKLEAKLTRLQSQKDNKTAKAMLRNFHDDKNLYFNELLKSDEQVLNINSNHETISSDQNETFLDKLYNTNSFYRHFNPQQGLDTNEKQPLVKHDHLNIHEDEIKNVT